MKTKLKDDLLIIRETPGCLWFIGLFFALIGGTFIYGALGGFENWHQTPRWQIELALLFGLIAVGVGVWQLWRAPVSEIVIDRRSRSVMYKKFGLSGRSADFYSFDQIKRFRTVEEKDSEGDPIWYFAIELSGGEVVKISSLPSHSEDVKRNIVFEANRFSGKQMSGLEKSNELEDRN